MVVTDWEPPANITREEIVAVSDRVLGRADLPIREEEFRFRIRVAELDWDVGGMVYEPTDPTSIAVGADGRKVGVFLLHGGGGDHRGKHRMAQFLASKFGYKVATMTYPGHLWFPDPSHDWPGDTINADDTCRTPLWNTDEPITADQYQVVEDRSDPVLRAKYGTLIFIRARPGTDFYNRMGAWPWAYEEAMREVCHRFLPSPEFSIYAHGHSTGGPFVHMLLQRVDNVAGLIGLESSPFGFLFSRMLNQGWDFPFTDMTVRTWRDTARYAGPEAGMAGIRRLAWLMEDVLESWEKSKKLPSIKAQHLVQFNAQGPLADAARATAQRLGMSQEETDDLVQRYQSYPRELSGPGTRPVPPLLYGINRNSRDHTEQRYRTILLPALAEMRPQPKVRLTVFGTGVHGYERADEGLPRGTLPAAADLWDQAIKQGYYAV